jgi:hypothetical protein
MSLALRSLSLLLLTLLLAAVPAQARSGQEVTFEAPRDLLGVDAAHREAAFDELDGLGVKALRVVLYWKDVAPSPDARVKPKRDMTDPDEYDWSRYQETLDEAHKRRWKVQLTLSGPVPRWATNGARDNVTRPSPNEFRMFVEAVSRHFGKDVARWSIWNEPNHPDFLAPQYDTRHRPVSPTVYRGLYAAALRGLAAVDDTKPVLMGETAPTGTGRVVAPLVFLRRALCLTDHYKRRKGCKKLRVNGYAHHAYTTRSGPTFVSRHRNDVMIGSLSRLTRALDRAAKAGVVRKSLPIYLTEFGIQSRPDPFYGVSYQRQNEYRAFSEKVAYRNRRVAAFSQYLLTDDPPLKGVPASERYGGFESGLRTAGGKAKLSLAGFRLPLVVTKTSKGKVALWGLVRPNEGSERVAVQVRDPGRSWRTAVRVSTDGRGMWQRRANRGSTRRQWRVRWTDAEGEVHRGPATRAMSAH